MNYSETDVLEIKKSLEQLKSLLEENRGDSLVIGLRYAIQDLADLDVPTDERITRARSIFKGMMGGAGTLGDFVIWDEREDRRNALNQQFDELLQELWDRLNCQ